MNTGSSTLNSALIPFREYCVFICVNLPSTSNYKYDAVVICADRKYKDYVYRKMLVQEYLKK